MNEERKLLCLKSFKDLIPQSLKKEIIYMLLNNGLLIWSIYLDVLIVLRSRKSTIQFLCSKRLQVIGGVSPIKLGILKKV